MPLADVYAHEEVKKALLTCLASGRLPNSLLFYGQDEPGMKKTALVLAQALNCLRLKNDACGACASCRAISHGNFPDVITLTLKEGSVLKVGSLDDLRPLAIRKPMMGRNRVFIIEEAEDMSLKAANSLLKTLEEPSPFSYFILISSQPDLIPATIRSRCRSFGFKPISREIIEDKLMALGYEPKQARLISILAEGSLERALTEDWEKIMSNRQQAWQYFYFLMTEGNSFLTRMLAASRNPDFKKDFEEIMRHFLTFFRDLLLLKEKGKEELLFNPDLADGMKTLSSAITSQLCLRGIELAEEVLSGLDRNLNARLLVLYFYTQLRREQNG
jgi:DNA polymerase-3 subunit delta'